MYNFFTYLINRIANVYNPEENRKIFSEKSAFKAIACLSAHVFSFCFQSLSGEYIEYCCLFEIDIVTAFKPINWFGVHLELTK